MSPGAHTATLDVKAPEASCHNAQTDWSDETKCNDHIGAHRQVHLHKKRRGRQRKSDQVLYVVRHKPSQLERDQRNHHTNHIYRKHLSHHWVVEKRITDPSSPTGQISLVAVLSSPAQTGVKVLESNTKKVVESFCLAPKVQNEKTI